MSRSFRRNQRAAQKTRRRNNPAKRHITEPDLSELHRQLDRTLEIQYPAATTGLAETPDATTPAIVELSPPRISASGRREPASFRILEGEPSPDTLRGLERAIRKINADAGEPGA